MKHKEKKKHLESRYLKPAKKSREKLNLQEHPLQHEEAGEDSHRSGYSTNISPTNKQSGADIKTFEDSAPQVLAEAPGGGPTEEHSCSSEYFSCVSFPSKLPPPDNHGTHRLHQSVFCLGSHGMPISESFRKRKNVDECLKRIYGDAWKEHAFRFHWRKATAQSGLPASAAGTIVTPVSTDLHQAETSSPSPHAKSLFRMRGNNKPCTSLVPGKDERVMTVYYMRVQMKRGRAVLEDPEEGLEPSSKKIKIEEMNYIEKVYENTPFSRKSMKRSLMDSRPYLDSRAQKKEKVERPATPPSLQVYPRASNPEWLVAHNSGFRCMACCRIFPSLEVLKEHVKHGFKEGFSCHTFHLTLARLKRKNRKEEEKGNQEGNISNASRKNMLL